MTFSSQWAHSDNDGDSVGLGMGYNFNVGPFLMTLGGKAVYLNPKMVMKVTPSPPVVALNSPWSVFHVFRRGLLLTGLNVQRR